MARSAALTNSAPSDTCPFHMTQPALARFHCTSSQRLATHPMPFHFLPSLCLPINQSQTNTFSSLIMCPALFAGAARAEQQSLVLLQTLAVAALA